MSNLAQKVFILVLKNKISVDEFTPASGFSFKLNLTYLFRFTLLSLTRCPERAGKPLRPSKPNGRPSSRCDEKT